MKPENALLSIILIILISGTASANHMQLLAVSETAGGYEGSVADIYLTIKPGSGRVFIDTFPLMKVDTQISTRFAKEIACDEAGIYCGDLDFFYTIRSGSSLVGGPSAGAAIAAMTYAELRHYPINESVAATGIINAGGIIGPVDGIKQKIEAAAKSSIKTVLIPEGENTQFGENESCFGNRTCAANTTLIEYAKKLGVDAVEVSSFQEVIYYITGRKEKVFSGNISKNAYYSAIMAGVADSLCNESYQMLSKLEKMNISYLNESILIQYEYAKNISNKSHSEMAEGNYYSAASYCFGSNLKFRFVEEEIENMSIGQIIDYYNNVSEFLKQSSEGLNRSYSTVTGLQAYMIVSSRLSEASGYLTDAMAEISENKSENAVYSIAYAEERTKSANLWKEFLGMPGKKVDVSSENLRAMCLSKVSEAQERYQYAYLFFQDNLKDVNDKIKKASSDAQQGNYEDCFSNAAVAKAEADTIIVLSDTAEKELPSLIEKRLDAAKQLILKEEEMGRFPIAGFSYYEYANSLKNDVPASALLYSGYALELSNMNAYFPPKRIISWNVIETILGIMLVFVSGAAAGAIVTIVTFKRRKRISREYKSLILRKKRKAVRRR